MMLTDYELRVLIAARSIAEQQRNTSYPSRASAQYVRDVMKRLLEITDKLEAELKQVRVTKV